MITKNNGVTKAKPRLKRTALAGRGKGGDATEQQEMVLTRSPLPNNTMGWGVGRRGRAAQPRCSILSVHMCGI